MPTSVPKRSFLQKLEGEKAVSRPCLQADSRGDSATTRAADVNPDVTLKAGSDLSMSMYIDIIKT